MIVVNFKTLILTKGFRYENTFAINKSYHAFHLILFVIYILINFNPEKCNKLPFAVTNYTINRH